MNTRIALAPIVLACATAALAQLAEAHVLRSSTATRRALTLLDATVMAPRSEPSSRHEPSMLDKLEGADLRNPYAEEVSGVVVVSVGSASAMWRNGLRPADVIVAVERDRVRSLGELEHALGRVSWGFVLEIAREGERICILVP